MSFFQRVLNHLLNEVMVEKLANRCVFAGEIRCSLPVSGRPRSCPAASGKGDRLVSAVLCSRAFQRFAIRTDAFLNEMKSKGTEKAAEHASTAAEKAVEHASFLGEFVKAFAREISKAGPAAVAKK